MGFIMDGLAAESYDRAYTDRQLLARILSYFRPYATLMLTASLLVVLNSAMDAALPFLISRGVDRLAQVGLAPERLAPLAAAILAAGVLSWLFNYLRQTLTARAVGDVVLDMRRDAFDAVMARDLSFYDENPSGKVVSRVTSDTQDFAQVVTLTLNLVSQVLLVGLVVALLFRVDARLAMIALTIAPVVVVTALMFRRVARRTTQNARRVLATVNSTVQETLRGIGVAKSFRQEGTIYLEFLAVNRQSYDVNLRQGWVFSSIFPILSTIAGIGTVLVLVYGGRAVLGSDLAYGDWYLFFQAIGLFWFPLTGIASFWSQFQSGLSAAERVFSLVDADPRVVQTGAEPIASARGAIRFEGVDFAYTPDASVLQAFDLNIPAGQTVALVGETGAGKSSIVRLVARFYEFQGGTIRMDGRDIRSLDLEAYRHQLGMVPQTPFLFSGTVADNIRYASPDADDAAVAAAAERIGGGQWLRALPGGLGTEVSEMGRGLSTGQRQLVVLARLILQDPAVIILDEATASVDPLTEAQIQDGLDTLLAGRTALIIAHRLSTIVRADRILVLDHGRVVEDGAHAQLVANAGRYAALYNAYFRHQSADYRPGEGFVAARAAGALP